jgi:hypothetical protein
MPDPLVARIVIEDDVPAPDANRLAELTRRLRSELRELPIEGVEGVVAGTLPAGAKGLDLTSLGELAVKVGPHVLAPVIGLIKGWIDRQPDQKLKVKIVVADRSVEIEHSQRLSPAELNLLVRKLTSSLVQD